MAMKIGISTFVNDDSIDTVSLARAIEGRGFDSLVVAEHTHIPASRETPYPQGGELPPGTTGRSIRSSLWPLLRR